MQTNAKGAYSRESLDHLTSTAIRTLDLAIKDPSHHSLLAVSEGEIIGTALGTNIASARLERNRGHRGAKFVLLPTSNLVSDGRLISLRSTESR